MKYRKSLKISVIYYLFERLGDYLNNTKERNNDMKLNYEYDPQDESQCYDIRNNPNDYNVTNLLLILSKYNFNISNKKLDEKDCIEIQRIIMRICEDAIHDINQDLKDYLSALLFCKYDHHFQYIVNANEIRARLHMRILNGQNIGVDKFEDFVKKSFLTKEDIIEAYYWCVDNDTYTNFDIEEDIKDFTENDIFDPIWMYGYLEKVSNYDTVVKEELNKYLLGGYFNVY